MSTISFYDFDEAHRAENARKMIEYQSYFIPLSGSPFDRVWNLKIPLKENPRLSLYYHLERPFFVYLLMGISANIFGDQEISYRLASFILGISTFVVFIYLVKKSANPFSWPAFLISLTSLLTATDLWLSSQYAQLDTGVTLFLFLSLGLLIHYIDNRKIIFLCISAVSFALAILSKGQPAVILIPSLLFLLIRRKLSLKELLVFSLVSATLIIPWIIYLSYTFGLAKFTEIFLGFAIYSSVNDYLHHNAPFFWYGRWWFDTLKPGWILFLSLAFLDVLRKRVDWKKQTLLVYVIINFLLLSLPANKLWWYVLPLIPAIAFYLYLSVSKYLQNYPSRLPNLACATLLSSLPIFIHNSNKITLTFGIFTTVVVIYLLNNDLFVKKVTRLGNQLLLLSLIIAFTICYLFFPKIVPYHKNTKEVAEYFFNLPGQKCLWVTDMPAEAALFYSKSGEINELREEYFRYEKYSHCTNYTMTPHDPSSSQFNFLKSKELILRRGNMRLLKISL